MDRVICRDLLQLRLPGKAATRERGAEIRHCSRQAPALQVYQKQMFTGAHRNFSKRPNIADKCKRT